MKIFTYARTLWHEFWIAFRKWVCPKPAPLKVNASINTPSDLGTRFGESWNRTDIDFESLRPEMQSAYPVWVYNTSRLDHTVDNPVLGKVTIPGNNTRKRYTMWTSFPSVMKLPSQCIGDNGQITISTIFMGGKDFVEDLINPDHNLQIKNITVSPRPMECFTAIGRDLSVKGVFWSLNNPPKKAEVDLAIEQMKNRYIDLVEKANVLWESSVISAKRYDCSLETAIQGVRSQDCKEITPEMHAAADYLKKVTSWHPVLRG